MKALWNQCQTVRQVSSSSPAAEDLVQTVRQQNAASSADVTGVDLGLSHVTGAMSQNEVRSRGWWETLTRDGGKKKGNICNIAFCNNYTSYRKQPSLRLTGFKEIDADTLAHNSLCSESLARQNEAQADRRRKLICAVLVHVFLTAQTGHDHYVTGTGSRSFELCTMQNLWTSGITRH